MLIIPLDLLIVAKQEIQCAMLLSLLVKHKIAPCYIEIYSIFNTAYKPSYLTVCKESSEYLYIRMEHANQGDLETYLRSSPSPLSSLSLLQFFFQIVLSLYISNQSVLLFLPSHL